MAHALGIATIAEGVETKEQLQFLLDNRCDLAQGHILSRALPANEIETFLAKKHHISK